jgi:hypothetical protein
MSASGDSYYRCFKLRVKEVRNWLTLTLQTDHFGADTTCFRSSFHCHFKPDEPQGYCDEDAARVSCYSRFHTKLGCRRNNRIVTVNLVTERFSS